MDERVGHIVRELKSINKPKIKVFVVDDDEMYLNILSHQLRESFGNSVSVFSFTSSDECIQSLYKNPDVLILDYMLDDDPIVSNGLQLYKFIKEEKPKIKVIMISGLEDIDIAVSSVKEGVLDFISKRKYAFKKIIRDIKLIIQDIIAEFNKKVHQRKVVGVTTSIVVCCIVAVWIFASRTVFS